MLNLKDIFYMKRYMKILVISLALVLVVTPVSGVYARSGSSDDSSETERSGSDDLLTEQQKQALEQQKKRAEQQREALKDQAENQREVADKIR